MITLSTLHGLVSAIGRFALPLALAAWCLFLLVGFGFAGPSFDPNRKEEAIQGIVQLLAAVMALLSASSSMHRSLHGPRSWTAIVAFGLSAGLLGFWFLAVVLLAS